MHVEEVVQTGPIIMYYQEIWENLYIMCNYKNLPHTMHVKQRDV